MERWIGGSPRAASPSARSRAARGDTDDAQVTAALARVARIQALTKSWQSAES